MVGLVEKRHDGALAGTVAVGREVSQLTTNCNPSQRDEEELFEASLREHGQLAEEDAEELPPGATHQVETNDKGERKVQRKRFSAI
jgi:hypothetical protein